MAAKKRGLGRGIDALLAASGTEIPSASNDGALQTLAIDAVSRGRYQPRSQIKQEALEELAASIRSQGVVQPIVVRPQADGRYEIIAGERRWRASQLAGLSAIPAVVREVPDSTALAIALIENIQREDLNAIDEALALRRLQEEFDLTHQQVAEAVGRSRAAVTNLLRLLDLADEVQKMLIDGKLEMGHARALLPLESMLQREAAMQVQMQGLSVRETENLARKLAQDKSVGGHGHGLEPHTPTAAAGDPDIRELQTDLSERLGAKVSIRHGSGGKGKLVINYTSLDELDGILSHIK